MVKDTLNSIFDNLKERTTNPFLGTLIVVWIVHNWKLLYSLFYFDSKLTLAERLCYIEEYFQKTPFYLNLFYVFLLTILVLSVTYLFLGLSRFITDFYEKRVIPKIVEFIDKTAIVLKSDYIAQQEVIRHLEERLEGERLAKATAQKERDESETKLAEILSNKPNLEQTLKREVTNSIPNSFIRVFNKAKQSWTVPKFNSYLTLIKNGTLLSAQDDIMKVLLLENFIMPGSKSNREGDKDYNLTDEGMAFLKYWNNLADDISGNENE